MPKNKKRKPAASLVQVLHLVQEHQVQTKIGAKMETVIQNKNCVLNQETIKRKIKRMALEVAERNTDEKDLVIAGINGNGEVLAEELAEELAQLAMFNVSSITVRLNKKDPAQVSLSSTAACTGKVVVLVDDVANTGKTMLYAMKPLLDLYPKTIQTLVLVERSHKLFPVQTDYAGLSIATTLQEHITVETAAGQLTGAFLY